MKILGPAEMAFACLSVYFELLMWSTNRQAKGDLPTPFLRIRRIGNLTLEPTDDLIIYNFNWFVAIAGFVISIMRCHELPGWSFCAHLIYSVLTIHFATAERFGYEALIVHENLPVLCTFTIMVMMLLELAIYRCLHALKTSTSTSTPPSLSIVDAAADGSVTTTNSTPPLTTNGQDIEGVVEDGRREVIERNMLEQNAPNSNNNEASNSNSNAASNSNNNAASNPMKSSTSNSNDKNKGKASASSSSSNAKKDEGDAVSNSVKLNGARNHTNISFRKRAAETNLKVAVPTSNSFQVLDDEHDKTT